MSEEKPKTWSRIVLWCTSHPWLKLIALLLAILVWFYVKGEIKNDY
jgi:hypothetical protein